MAFLTNFDAHSVLNSVQRPQQHAQEFQRNILKFSWDILQTSFVVIVPT